VKKPKVMVIYGYHTDEQFHPLVARDVERKMLPNVSVVKFEGEHVPRELDRHGYPERRFIRMQPRADYVIQLCSSEHVPANDDRYPAIDFGFMSKAKMLSALQTGLESHMRKYENVLGRHILRAYIDEYRDTSKRYDRMLIDYVSRYVPRNRAGEFLVDIIGVLQQHPRRV